LGFLAVSAFLPVSGWAKDDAPGGGDKKASPAKMTIAVIGDSLADGIWGGLSRKLYRDKRFCVHRGAKNSVGFGASDMLETLDRAFEAGPVDAVVMMIGANDRRGIYGSDGWKRYPSSAAMPIATRAQLQPALPGPVAAGFLAPLAHVAVELAARLPVYPARRPPLGRAGDRPRPAGCLGSGRQALRIVLVLHFVCLCWVFFRAKDMTAAGDLLGQLADWSAAPQLVTPFLVGLVILGLLMQATLANLLQWLDRAYHAMSPWVVGVLGGLLLLTIEALGGDGSAPFIYFQF
jgi:hypothetical protein